MIVIDKQSRVPVYEQVIEQFEKLIISGALLPNTQIPSVRALALELTINPNTVQKAYLELENSGVTYSVTGIGRFVSKDAKEKIEKRSEKRLEFLRDTLKRIRLSGVEKQTLLSLIEDIYKENNND